MNIPLGALASKVGNAINELGQTGKMVALSMHGDSVYLLDADQVINKSFLQLETKLLIETAKDVITNVFSEYTSLGNLIQGGVGVLNYVETYLSMFMNAGYLGDYAWYYKFRINPEGVSITRRKKQTITHYGWGLYDLEYFGDEIVTLSFRGKTGNMMPIPPLPSVGIRDPRLSISYIKFAQLEKFYRKNSNSLFLTFYGRVYYGYLSELSYSLDANNPRTINYNFVFNAHPQFIFDIFTGNFEELEENNPLSWNNQSKASILQGGLEYNAYIPKYNLGFP